MMRHRRAGALVVAAVVAAALLGTLLVVVFALLEVLAGPVVAVVLLVLAAADVGIWTWRYRSPGHRRLRAWLDEPTSSGTAPPRPAPGRPCAVPEPASSAAPHTAPAPAAVSTDELCRRWQRSYWVLQGMSSAQQRWAVVVLRGHLLDELERRDPTGFARWLQTEPRPVGDPGRYLTTGSMGA